MLACINADIINAFWKSFSVIEIFLCIIGICNYEGWIDLNADNYEFDSRFWWIEIYFEMIAFDSIW